MDVKNIIVSVHQPNFLPWIGYFYKIAKSDIFVYLDNVQFIKRSYINRVKIKTINGAQWITVPVKTKGRYLQEIDKVEIDNNLDWRKKFLGMLKTNYSKSPFFEFYFSNLKERISKDFCCLIDLNIELIDWIFVELAINKKVLRASEIIDDNYKSTDRIISICKALAANAYLSGFGGQNYQEKFIFDKNNIDLKVYNFKHPVYKQLWGEFVPGLSILDYMFNIDIEKIKEFFNEIQ